MEDKELTFPFSFEDIKSFKIRIKEVINLNCQLLLGFSDRRKIPLTRIEELKTLNII